jgi:hypothetical protein
MSSHRPVGGESSPIGTCSPHRPATTVRDLRPGRRRPVRAAGGASRSFNRFNGSGHDPAGRTASVHFVRSSATVGAFRARYCGGVRRDAGHLGWNRDPWGRGAGVVPIKDWNGTPEPVRIRGHPPAPGVHGVVRRAVHRMLPPFQDQSATCRAVSVVSAMHPFCASLRSVCDWFPFVHALAVKVHERNSSSRSPEPAAIGLRARLGQHLIHKGTKRRGPRARRCGDVIGIVWRQFRVGEGRASGPWVPCVPSMFVHRRRDQFVPSDGVRVAAIRSYCLIDCFCGPSNVP